MQGRRRKQVGAWEREIQGGGKLRLLFLLIFLGVGKPLASFPPIGEDWRRAAGFILGGRAEFAC